MTLVTLRAVSQSCDVLEMDKILNVVLCLMVDLGFATDFIDSSI